MSHLELTHGIADFSKAVISLWFRVPRESVEAAAENYIETGVEDFWIMQGILPLMTFGRPQQNNNFKLVFSKDIAHGDPGETAVYPAYIDWTNGDPYLIEPSYIGLQCVPEGRFKLVFNLQSEKYGSYDSLIWFCTDMAYIDYHGEPPEGSGIAGTWFVTTIQDGTKGIQEAQPEFFHVESQNYFAPDIWHHLLLSFDLDGHLDIGPKPESTCQLWYAIDDVDYRGWENLGPLRQEDDELGPNNIVTPNIWRYSFFDPTTPSLFFNHYVADPTGTCSPQFIPSGEAAIGLPAAERYSDAIFKVEMAEFQMWTGVTVDTEDDRRAFVDVEGKPVDPAEAERRLGRKPDILLHRSSNWKKGKNTGSVGQDENGDLITSGQFIPTGAIDSYKPEPELGK